MGSAAFKAVGTGRASVRRVRFPSTSALACVSEAKAEIGRLDAVSDARRRYGRSNQAKRNAAAALVELGVLETYGDGRYVRVYWSPRVLRAIEPSP